MIDRLLDILRDAYPLTELDAGEFSHMKVSGMRFDIRAFCAQGLGHVSSMTASGFLGLMRMQTLIIVPREKDLPLYSYDRILAAGKDTLMVELYDTLAGSCDLSGFEAIRQKLSSVPDRDPGTHWYDSIRLPQSICKNGKKGADFDRAAADCLRAFLSVDASDSFDREKKLSKTRCYVSGLIANGGPSTDVFKKSIGEEKTGELFKRVLFGTDLQ